MNRCILAAAPVRGIATVVLLAVSGCAGYGPGDSARMDPCSDANHNVTITFDGAGCPTAVSVAEIHVDHKNPWIKWESSPSGNEFGIFFDPLMGPQYLSNGTGCVRKKINTRVPPIPGTMKSVVYKYAVATVDISNKINPDCNALDPKVIVEH